MQPPGIQLVRQSPGTPATGVPADKQNFRQDTVPLRAPEPAPLGRLISTCDNGTGYHLEVVAAGCRKLPDPRTFPLEDSMLPGAPVLCMMLLAHLVAVEDPVADSGSGKEEAAPLSYNQDIRPILSNKCFPCHGPDSAARKAGLRLDNAEDAYRDRDGFAAVIPGDIEKSLLVDKIHAEDPDDRMPPPESRRSLSAVQRAQLVLWIEQGAQYEPHWAWQSPLRPDPPTISGDSTPQPIDAFIRAHLEQQQLPWKQRADRETLIRRATFDLTGLPPTIEEIDSFVADTDPDSWKRLLDRLLASERFGEHWGRMWLDAARYADTHGLHLDNYREMWPYRDRIIELFNENPPFDQFVIGQLAGDLLPQAQLEDQVASGFVRSHPTTSEGGAINDEYRMIYSVDRTNTFATVFLGLTAGCAQCHEHKFDPISQQEYYGLYSFFHNTTEAEMDGNAKAHAPVVKVPSREQSSRMARFEEDLTAAKEQRDAPDPEMDAAQLVFEQQWAETSRRWQIITPEQLTASGGATFEALPDGSHLASGANPAKDTYTLTAVIDGATFRALRLEGLLDPSMPGNGPGRSSNSNVVLSEIQAQVIAVDGELNTIGEPLPISFTGAWADHEQPKFPVSAAIDGDVTATDKGWGVSGFDLKEPRTAIFSSDEPFGAEGMARLTVRFLFESQYAKHAFGRVRFALAEQVHPDAEELSWVDDYQDNGGVTTTGGANRDWDWVTGPDHPVHSGERSRLQKVDKDRIIQHFFHKATNTRTVHEGDRFYAWVWIDEEQPTKTVMLQFHSNNSWDHRGFWGEDLINFGGLGVDVVAHRPMGDLPAKGQWVRLEIDAAHVGLAAGAVIDGFAFTQFGGKAYWDDAGILGYGEKLQLEALLSTPIELRSDKDAVEIRRWFRQRHSPDYTVLLEQIQKLEGERSTLEGMIPTTLVAAERMDRRPARMLNRGQYDQPVGDPIEPNVPAFLPPMPEQFPKNRLGLAQWLTDPQHPLLARVTVNRIWQQLFGTGIVRTAEDFGSQGEWPSHPELLDWLARDFVDEGWDLKRFIRSLMLTETYCQLAHITELDLERDPGNRLLARGPRFRMDAEMIRDQALFISGLLIEKMGGPSVKPYQPPGLWKAVGYSGSNTVKFSKDTGEALYRRSIYTFWKRTSPPPFLAILDAPNRETCVVRRERTNTPMQALLLLNDIQYIETARHLAERLQRDLPDADDTGRLSYLWRLATARPPTTEEIEQLESFLAEVRIHYGDNEAAALELLSVGDSPRGEALSPAEHAAWTLICNLVLNLDEVVTKG